MTALRALVLGAALSAAGAAFALDPQPWSDRCNPQREYASKETPLFWYRCTDGDTVIVFVHGGTSDNLEAWQNTDERGFVRGRLLQKAFWVRRPLTGQDHYWPWILAEDRRFAGAAIALVGYYSAFLSMIYGADDAAEEWYAHLRTPSPATGRAVMDYRQILIVAHSTGGIVARYAIAKYASAFAGKRLGLLLLASPAGGAKLVDGFPGRLAVVLGAHRQGWQVQSGSEFLARVDACFRKVRDDERRGFELLAREIAETAPYGTTACRGGGSLGLRKIVEPDKAIVHFRDGDPVTHLPSVALDAQRDGERICFDHEALARPMPGRSEPHELLTELYVKGFAERPLAAGRAIAEWGRLAPAEQTAEHLIELRAAAGEEVRRNPLDCEAR
ncbi:MAG TPA: hypothetical protein VKC64_07745 [Burkholderiales bacterium]|nr:hypothetical protein [Burkholderiales bacterium]